MNFLFKYMKLLKILKTYNVIVFKFDMIIYFEKMSWLSLKQITRKIIELQILVRTQNYQLNNLKIIKKLTNIKEL